MQEEKMRQVSMYREKLTRFVARLRDGDAHSYGYRNILRSFFPDSETTPEGPTLFIWDENLLSEEEKVLIVKEVIKETGLSQGELPGLLEIADKQFIEEMALAEKQMEEMMKGNKK